MSKYIKLEVLEDYQLPHFFTELNPIEKENQVLFW
jgi:hypothetical protein